MRSSKLHIPANSKTPFSSEMIVMVNRLQSYRQRIKDRIQEVRNRSYQGDTRIVSSIVGNQDVIDSCCTIIANIFCATGKGGGRDATCRKDASGKLVPAPSMKDTAAKVVALRASGKATPEALTALLASHTVAELKSLEKALGAHVKGNPSKADRLKKIVDAAKVESVKKENIAEGGNKGPKSEPEPSTKKDTLKVGRKPEAQKRQVKDEVNHGKDNKSQPRGSGPVHEGSSQHGGGLEKETTRPPDKTTDKGGESSGKPASKESAKDAQGHKEVIPTTIEEANRRIDRFEKFFRDKGQHEQADWMKQLKDHVNTVGTDEALKSLGEEVKGKGATEKVQYGGVSDDISHFTKTYLEKNGITPITMGSKAGDTSKRLISSVAPSSTGGEGIEGRGELGAKHGDVMPKLQGLRDKLHESQHLPGLEKSEDIGKLMGGKFGDRIEHFTPAVVSKLDETYGKDKWIVKSYGDEAYAGYGIFFPQRVAQINQEAKSTIWDSGSHLAAHGFMHLRDKDGTVVGIKHHSGDEYPFDSEKYKSTIHGSVREWGDKVAAVAPNEKHTKIPAGSFMAQPAFDVVGISNEERAAGVTFKKGQEGRVHIVTRDGKAEVVPHSTWLKQEHLPVVFENDDTRAMAKAAMDAINALPHHEKQGQLYAPDIVKTKDGYKVVEANPANEAGASGYLADNPFIIDSYVSHLTNREPAHVKFVRSLLTKGSKVTNRLKTFKWDPSISANQNIFNLLDYVSNFNPNHDEKGRFSSGDSKGSGQDKARPFILDKVIDTITGLFKKKVKKADPYVGKEHSPDKVKEIMASQESMNGVKSIKEHGMSENETMKSVVVQGKEYHYTDKTKEFTAKLIVDVHNANIPDNLKGAGVPTIVSNQPSKDDQHWKRTYNKFEQSVATGGDGKIVYYNGGKGTDTLGTQIHENGHNLAKAVWDTTTPPERSDYGKAQRVEKPVTEYGANSPSEDFAEACRLYVLNKDHLRNNFPLKYKEIDKMMNESIKDQRLFFHPSTGTKKNSGRSGRRSMN